MVAIITEKQHRQDRELCEATIKRWVYKQGQSMGSRAAAAAALKHNACFVSSLATHEVAKRKWKLLPLPHWCPAPWGRDRKAIAIPLGDNDRQQEGLVYRCEASTSDQKGVTSSRPSHPRLRVPASLQGFPWPLMVCRLPWIQACWHSRCAL